MIGKILPQKPQASLAQLCRWAWGASRGVRGRVGMICLLGILRVGASLSFVWISKMLIDDATHRSTPESTVWSLAALLTACMLVELALSQARNYVNSLAAQQMTNSLRRRIYRHLLDSDLYSQRRHSGDILNRITVDVASVVNTVMNILPDILVMIVQLVAAFWLLSLMNPLLALCALCITPVCILASKFYMMKMRRINAEIRQDESLIHTNLQEGLQHQIVVQTLECQPEMASRFERLQQVLFGNVVWRTRISLYSRTTVRLGFIAGYLIAFIWSVFGLHSGAITYGMMTAFLQLVGRIQMPISSLSSTVPSLVGTATAIDRLMEIYPAAFASQRADLHEALSSKVDMEGPAVGIRVTDIIFSYPESEVRVFDHFSHDFAPGSKTVVMGPTGVGKSTLTKLILALLTPESGIVEVYHADRNERVSPSTRSLMTYVPQGNSLLHGSIADNLRLGNPSASDEQIRAALHTACANFVFDLPDGLDTPCGELGSRLSEGQCQRIAIARALLRQCPVLILDEFNSSLDEPTADLLLSRLIATHPTSTIIFISHRPTVASHCDQVLRLG